MKEDAPVLVLEHVRLIDGTGSAPQKDMRIDIAGGKITAVQAASTHSPYPPNAKVLISANFRPNSSREVGKTAAILCESSAGV